MLKKLGKRGIEMEMEMVVNNKFLEMNEKEMMDVDGGIVFTATGLAIGIGLAWVAKKVGVVGVSKIIVLRFDKSS